MNKKLRIVLQVSILIILSFPLCALKAQTVQSESGNVYEVDPGTKGNQIILEIANTSKTMEANNVDVKLIKSSKQLKFKDEEQTINHLDKKKEADVTFAFDINVTAPANTKDTVEFQISGKGINQTKSFVLKYSAPKQYALYQNYPNPFNPTTTIRYSIPETQHAASVQLKVYDILGREITTLVNKEQKAGNYEVKFNGSRYASGIYIYRLTADNFVSIKKMMMVK